MATSSIQNLNKPKDAFEQLEDEEGTRQGFCHIRIQQRTGRKTITTVQGIAPEYDLKKIVRYLKKMRGATSLSNIRMLFALIIFRLLNALLVRTYFVPDELFQSVEVAHRAVYGVGYVSWEWKWSLRSVLHPACIALLYRIGRSLGIDSALYVTEAPRLLHALLFAFSDFSFYGLAHRTLASHSAASYALTSYLSCWFVWYCAPRTLSNALETALVLYALHWYPLTAKDLATRRCWPYISLGFVSILIRPTAILIWIPLGLWHLWRSSSPFRLIFGVCAPACLPTLLAALLLDSAVYGRWTLTIWNFASFNVFQGGSAHFGSHPWHWFLIQGLPAVLTVQLIPIIGGVWLACRNGSLHFSSPPPLIFAITPILYVTGHSFIAHKEHRFLLPIIPLLCLFAGYFLNSGLLYWKRKTGNRMIFTRRSLWIGLLLVVNIPMALYLGLYHQAGVFTATRWIGEHLASRRFSATKKHFEIVQLMPCFSMPQYSYFHGLNVSITALDCSPNLEYKNDYVDQADQFHIDPNRWIVENAKLLEGADYIVMYEKTYQLTKRLISSLNFRLCSRFFHAHFLSSPRQDHYIVVTCR
ncbi:unnamed protein product [Gongylonema pulchrum]|uniref:Mannosyltransferase n=1 Tax=Gongylonema pulchrum TaxID=637853 RepID=A0A183EAH5_9BILA|nr:unnamed protein product [Gongylonema pulchrum]